MGCRPLRSRELKALLARVPFEVVLHFGSLVIGRDPILDLLTNILSSRAWNPIHEFLGDWVRAPDSVLVTPNYDVGIECSVLGSPNRTDLDQQLLGRGIQRVYANTSGGKPNRGSLLFKLHGTIDHPESIVFEMPQEAQLDQWKQDLLSDVLSERAVLFVGYSGVDFEVLPELLRLPLQKVYWNALHWDSLKQSPGAALLIQAKRGLPLIGHMCDLFRGLGLRREVEEPLREVGALEDAVREAFLVETRKAWFGVTLTRLGVGCAARAVLEDATRAYPGSEVIARDLGVALFHEGRYRSAYRHLRRIALKRCRTRPAGAVGRCPARRRTSGGLLTHHATSLPPLTTSS